MADVDGQVKHEELDPEREARRRLALAQIRQYPDAALKMPARPVEQFDDELVSLVERMKRLMEDAQGVGLAANQVGVLQGILVPVERPTTVTVVGRDEHGEEVRYELEEVYARAAQHETDHLDGKLM